MEHFPGAKLIDKAVDVLFLCRDAGGPVGVTEAARRLGMPKSSAARIVGALVRRGFLRQEEPSGKYALSNVYYSFTSALSERNLLTPRAVPVMEKVFRALRIGRGGLNRAGDPRRCILFEKAGHTCILSLVEDFLGSFCTILRSASRAATSV